MDDIDITNKQMVGVRGNNIVFLNPPTKMTKREALVMAAWIVCLAENDEDDFGLIVEAVQS